MPGIIKIGRTDLTVEDRIKSLDNTSLPLPFRFYFAIKTTRDKDIEKLIHNAFSDFRIRENREFFRMDPERAVSALRISGSEEIKISNDMIDDTGQIIEENAQQNNKEKIVKFNFEMLNIPIGAELLYTRDEAIKCYVTNNNRVLYNDEVFSLSALADKLLKEQGYNWKSVQGPLYFEYNGKILDDIKKEFLSNQIKDEQLIG